MCKSTCADCQVETTDTDETGTVILCQDCCYARDLSAAVELYESEYLSHRAHEPALRTALEAYPISRKDLVAALVEQLQSLA